MLKTHDLPLSPYAGLSQHTQYTHKHLGLINAVTNNQMDAVKALLTRGASPNSANIHGQTPILIAARDGHLEMVTELLNHGADPEYRTRCGNTPLYISAVGSHYDITKLLLLHQVHRYQPTNAYYKVLLRLNAHTLSLIQQSTSFKTVTESESHRHEKIEFLILLIEILLKQATFKKNDMLHAISTLERRFENAIYYAANPTRTLFLATLKCVYTGNTSEF